MTHVMNPPESSPPGLATAVARVAEEAVRLPPGAIERLTFLAAGGAPAW
jgi:hypothetical protein